LVERLNENCLSLMPLCCSVNTQIIQNVIDY